MDNFFKFKQNRDSGSVRLVFFARELEQKPIKYWANVGRIPNDSEMYNLVKKIKSQLDVTWGNNICQLAYYSGAHLTFPYHVQWMDDKFEFTLFSTFGEGKPTLCISRNVKNENEHFTDDDIRKINKFMETEYHLIRDSYRLIKEFYTTETGYSEVQKLIKNIKEKIVQKHE